MPSIKDFVEAMSTSWPVALAIFLGSAATLLGEWLGISYLTTLPEWLLGAVFLIAVFSAAVVAVSILQVIARIATMPFRRRRARQWKAARVAQLDNLPPREMHVLAWAAAQNTQVFLAPYNDELLEPLVAKGIVDMIPGHHSIIRWPYRIPDYIWDEVRPEIMKHSNPDQIPNPFDRMW